MMKLQESNSTKLSKLKCDSPAVGLGRAGSYENLVIDLIPTLTKEATRPSRAQ
jgi:hypothetical protein